MKRSRKMVLLCHCILNCNSKLECPTVYEGAMADIAGFLIGEGIGLIQLPCPELTMYGCRRWGCTVEQLDTPYYRRHCRDILRSYIEQLQDYLKNDYQLLGILGIDGSPSCGVNITCSGSWGGELSGHPELLDTISSIRSVSAKGIFIEELEKLMDEADIAIPIMGIDESDMEGSLERLKTALGGYAQADFHKKLNKEEIQ